MSAGVVVPQCFGAPEAFQERIGRQNHVLNLLDAAILTAGYRRHVLHDALCRFGLPRTRLSRNDNALVLLVGIHVVIGGLRDTKDMRGDLESVLALIPM